MDTITLKYADVNSCFAEEKIFLSDYGSSEALKSGIRKVTLKYLKMGWKLVNMLCQDSFICFPKFELGSDAK